MHLLLICIFKTKVYCIIETCFNFNDWLLYHICFRSENTFGNADDLDGPDDLNDPDDPDDPDEPKESYKPDELDEFIKSFGNSINYIIQHGSLVKIVETFSNISSEDYQSQKKAFKNIKE